jgi:hypothetical protein
MHEYSKNLKIIFILRNPIEKTYSHYEMRLRAGRASKNVKDEISIGSKIIDTGLYYKHIKKYNKYFDSKNIRVELFSDLKIEPEFVIDDVLKFLRVDTGLEPSNLEIKYGRSKSLPKFSMYGSF